MSDLKTSLRQLAERGTPAGSERLRQRVAVELAGSPTRRESRVVPGLAVAVGVTVVTIAVIGGASVLLGGSDPSALQPSATQPTTAPPVSTSVAEILDPVETPTLYGAWNPILTETVAGVTPQAATCPFGAIPDLPGLIDQDRPGEGPWGNQAGVFDTHAGRIVFLDEGGETWTFDVCSNTWERMEPHGVLPGRNVGVLVYDVDSDRTIAFGPAGVSVYNASTNSWSLRSGPLDMSFEGFWLGSVYDPITGLVLTVTTEGALTAYDVDTDTWTEVGRIIEAREITSEGQTQTVVPGFLVGYMAETDRLVFLGFDGAPFQDEGGLLNPRTGGTAPINPPVGGVRGGFGSFGYATGGETAYVYGSGVCRLDPIGLVWDCNAASRQMEGSSAMVFDPINNRIVVISNSCCTWPGTTVTDGVYAIDFTAGHRIELLATANTRTETDGS